MAEKEQALEVEGVVTQALANTRFRVQITGGHIVNAHVAGKMRKNFIRIVPKSGLRARRWPRLEAPDGSPGTPGCWASPDRRGTLGVVQTRSPPAPAGGFYSNVAFPNLPDHQRINARSASEGIREQTAV